jgi:prepilin-type processing-associated H-X9-DG protein
MLHGKGKKMNYLFADYHVETHEPNKTFGTGLYDNPRGMWTRRIGD